VPDGKSLSLSNGFQSGPLLTKTDNNNIIAVVKFYPCESPAVLSTNFDGVCGYNNIICRVHKYFGFIALQQTTLIFNLFA